MKNIKALAVAFGIALSPALAHAQDAAAPVAATVKAGAMVFSADGRRIGRVDRVKIDNGSPSAVSIIYNGRFINIPVATLTASDRGLTSSLTKADLAKM